MSKDEKSDEPQRTNLQLAGILLAASAFVTENVPTKSIAAIAAATKRNKNPNLLFFIKSPPKFNVF